MRILAVSDVSSHMRGGVPIETRMLVRGLLALGHEVAMACDAPMAGCEGAKHYPLSVPVQGALVGEVGRILADFKPEFVHVLCMNSRGISKLRAVLGAHPWALTVHSIPPYERKLGALHAWESLHYGTRALRYLANSLAWRWIFKRQMAPRVIVHSEFVRRIALSYGCEERRVILIPLPFARGPSTAADLGGVDFGASVSVVSVGGLAHTKGQHDLVKSLPALVAQHPGLRCELIGEVRDASYLAYLRGLAENLQVSKQLKITINASHAHKARALAAADVYVQPSHEEGFCLAYAEGAIVVPRVVGTDTGAIRAMSEDDIGMRVVPTRHARALGQAIAELIRVELPPGHMRARIERMKLASSDQGYLRAHLSLYRQSATA